MSIFGCAQTTSNYYYVSLERVADIKVVNRAKVKLDNLEKNSDIPTEYILPRDRYSLSFFIGDKSYYPHVKIVVNGVDRVFFINPRRDVDVVSSEGGICASYYLDSNDRSLLEFSWSVNCIKENIKKVISFDLVDSSGEVFAEESIPFMIEHDGEYTNLDAI